MSFEELGWPATLTLAISLIVALIWITGSPQFLMANFPLSLVGLSLLGIALRSTRRWLLLLCLPVLLAPFYLPSFLLIACLNGDCL